MSTLKGLIHEIHRRSLWQVLGIYIITAWVVLQVVELLTESAGLPGWTPGFALVLVLIGLPVCLATAIVQEGLPGGDRSEENQPKSSAPSSVTPAAGDVGARTGTPSGSSASRGGGDPGLPSPPAGLRRLLTWRNAVLGGVGAFALLGLSVFAYFVMWSTGIGPVGSLVAQGVLDERDPVVLAHFGNGTSHEGLGEVVTEALRVDLLESPVLTLMPPAQVSEVLSRMGRSPDEAVTPALAQEIAVREGIKAIIQGEVSSAGSAYVIRASVVAGESGEILKAFRETARSDDDVVDAIDRLSQGIREGLGESLRNIRAGEPLEQATTGSLAALQKLTQAERAEESGDYPAALALLEEAVALDPEFAMAYRKIAVLLFNQGSDFERARAVTELAYRHRDRLTERERYLAEAYYHSQVTGDEPAEMLAYRNALRVAPDASAALNNLALAHMDRGELDEALLLLERAVGGPGESSVANGNLVRVRVALGDRAGARAALSRYEERYPNHLFLTWARAHLASLEADSAGVHGAARDLSDDERAPPALRVRGAHYAAVYDVTRGALVEAKRHYAEAVGVAQRLDRPHDALEMALRAVGVDRVFSLQGAKPEGIEAVLSRWDFNGIAPSQRPWLSAIRELAYAGRPDRAASLLEAWEVLVTSDHEDPGLADDRRVAQSLIQAAQGRPDEALERLFEVQRDRDCDRCELIFMAPMLERAGRHAAAAEAWERILREPIATGFDHWWPQDRMEALIRLGPLHERLGDSTRAAAAYQAFADAWAHGDPEERPRVEEARARAAALRQGSLQ